jgi:hypothetical protein
MKKLFSLLLMVCALPMLTNAQNKERVSPRITTTETLDNGATITIAYGQPSVKGRTIGVDVEPKNGHLWRTGANEATVFETDKNIRIMGKELPAGKYSILTIYEEKYVTVIFNSDITLWGIKNYEESKDVIRVKAKYEPTETFAEQLTFTIGKTGQVGVHWGNKKFLLHIK